jgi:hypothetical protein
MNNTFRDSIDAAKPLAPCFVFAVVMAFAIDPVFWLMAALMVFLWLLVFAGDFQMWNDRRREQAR